MPCCLRPDRLVVRRAARKTVSHGVNSPERLTRPAHARQVPPKTLGHGIEFLQGRVMEASTMPFDANFPIEQQYGCRPSLPPPPPHPSSSLSSRSQTKRSGRKNGVIFLSVIFQHILSSWQYIENIVYIQGFLLPFCIIDAKLQ